MKAMVIYDSIFGNTEKVAEAIGKAIGSEAEQNVVKVSDDGAVRLQGVDVLIVGSPTRGFRPTEGITNS
jgi:flavodoxin